MSLITLKASVSQWISSLTGIFVEPCFLIGCWFPCVVPHILIFMSAKSADSTSLPDIQCLCQAFDWFRSFSFGRWWIAGGTWWNLHGFDWIRWIYSLRIKHGCGWLDNPIYGWMSYSNPRVQGISSCHVCLPGDRNPKNQLEMMDLRSKRPPSFQGTWSPWLSRWLSS